MPSAFFHGVTVTLIDSGPRPIATPSASIIGLVDTYTPTTALAPPHQPVLLTNQREAVQLFGAGSAIAQSTRGVFAQSAAVVVAVGVPVNATAPPEELPEKPVRKSTAPSIVTESNPLMTALIGGIGADGQRTGMQVLLDGKSVHNAQPRLILCPGHSAHPAIATALQALADKLKAIAIIDGPNRDDQAAIQYFAEISSQRVYAVDPWLKIWNAESDTIQIVPASPAVAGLFAKTDRQIGFWASPSNKALLEVIGTARPIEFIEGDDSCRANLLNSAHIATIIREGSYRLWGNHSCSSDPKWAFITRVRTVDMVMEALLLGHQWAVDRSITKTYLKEVTEGIQAFMRDLRAQGAIINFEVYPDEALNSPTQLEQGRVYWTIRFTDVPPAENPNFRVEVTNQWISEVLDL